MEKSTEPNAVWLPAVKTRAQFVRELRTLANRQIVAENGGAIDKQADETVTALRKEHAKTGVYLEDKDYETIREQVRERLVDSLIRYYDPAVGTKPTTYTYGTANLAAKRAAAEMIDWRVHFGLSADQPVEGGDANSAPLTHAEAQGDGARSVGRLVAQMDLRFLRRFMSPVERFVFDARYFGGVDDATLYTKLGWTESRGRWFLRNYERKFAKLADLAGHVRRPRR